jgi:hypothetical protein
MKKRNTIISAVLIVVAVVLIVVLYNSIMRPVKFENEYNKRSEQVITKMKDLRAIQELYKSAHGEFCNDIDSLLLFLETGKVPMVQKSFLPGYDPDAMTEFEAQKKGLLKRDTTWVEPIKKLVEEKKLLTPAEKVAELKYIPFSKDNKEVFEMNAKKVNKGGLEVPVFQITAPIATYTFGMERQDVINRKAELEDKNKYPGWKVGDLEQPITDGNWE